MYMCTRIHMIHSKLSKDIHVYVYMYKYVYHIHIYMYMCKYI